MNICKTIGLAGCAFFAAAAAADDTPVVSGVMMSQQDTGRLVTITYSLANAPAVITLDVETNCTEEGVVKWASIGGEAVSNAKGDVWKKVGAAGSVFNGTITWRPDFSWEGHRIAAGGARAVVTAWSLDNTPDYMVVDISDAARPDTQTYYPAAEYVPGGILGKTDYRTSFMVMRKIMAKDVTWTMGSTTVESKRKNDETTHQVALDGNYYIGVFPVTQAQWVSVATNASLTAYFTTEAAMRPMEKVSYNEVRNTHNASTTADTVSAGELTANPSPDSFLGLLRLKTGIDFDLPSEAQWEFAARAGNGVGYYGNGSTVKNTNNSEDPNLSLLGRYKRNGGKIGEDYATDPSADCGVENGTAIVGTYKRNSWGLYDMHGNVFEWCLDWYEANIATAKDASGNLYGGRVNINPDDMSLGLSGAAVTKRVMRGGSWCYEADTCRSAYRNSLQPYFRYNFVGFRVVCTAGLK